MTYEQIAREELARLGRTPEQIEDILKSVSGFFGATAIVVSKKDLPPEKEAHLRQLLRGNFKLPREVLLHRAQACQDWILRQQKCN